MIINDLNNKQFEIISITKQLYQHYLSLEKELESKTLWYLQQKEQGEELIKALKMIYSYNGENEEALKLQNIAEKVLWDTIWDLY